MTQIPWLKVSNKFDYRPWPELRHTASVLRQLAAEAPKGSAHLVRAALVFTAFSVEGFVQTLGPGVFGEEWEVFERLPVLKRVKLMGKRLGVEVDFGRQPWQDVKALFEARDSLAHAKPRQIALDIHCPTNDHDELLMQIGRIMRETAHPKADATWIGGVSQSIDEALQEIWDAAGREPAEFLAFGSTMSSSAAE